jgi:hypothetical protein
MVDVILEAIQFNHDRRGATHDAFNIRFNEANAVALPEWRRGATFTAEQCPAAYAINETRGHTLTIRASFTGPANASILIRAVEARLDRAEMHGCNPISLLWPFGPTFGARLANVLGEVVGREIKFDANGEADLQEFTLTNVLIWRGGVSVSNTEWRWQFREKSANRWTDLVTTRHRIYTVLEIPNCPWQQNPLNEAELTQLPWADALEYACDWAGGAQDVDEAATLITSNIYNLGRVGRVEYVGSPFYSSPTFNCTLFLELLAGGQGVQPYMNCSDCATTVSSFANLVGCDLRQLGLGPAQFWTNLIREIGKTQEAPDFFFGHEVAWKGDVSDDGKVFDACLQVDSDPTPGAEPFEPLLPTNLRFGSASDMQYRFRLNSEATPLTLDCRSVGYRIAGHGRKLDDSLLEFLRVHYDFASWANLPPEKNCSPAKSVLSEPLLLHEWKLRSPAQHPQFIGAVNGIQLLWESPTDPDALLRADIIELQDWQSAREFMLRRLGEFHQLKVHRLTEPEIGDVSFAQQDQLAVLFTRCQFVVLVRSAGRTKLPIVKTATRVDDHFLYLR